MKFETLKNPPAPFRGMPFWAWNGRLDKKELIRQVRIFKQMGFGGFFMHSRSGLSTEYLGAEWFACIRACAKEAERLGLHAYIYDEDRWPSGTAGGRVTKNPKYRIKYISLHTVSRGQFDLAAFGQEYLAAFAVRLARGTLLDYYPVVDRAEIKDGYVAAVFCVEEMAKDPFYNGYTYLDTLNPQAVGCFIAETHEKYRSAVGDLFGNAIRGIFTDEPHRGCIFGGFALPNENKHGMTPYAYGLFDTFLSVCGYDLLPRLPEIYWASGPDAFSKTAYDYVRTLQQLFLDSFAGPYRIWCAQNKLTVTGHILHEDSLSAQTAMSGSMMRYYEYMDYPGIDVLTEQNRAYWVAKQAQSVVRQLNKPFLLSELYGCTGWQFNFEGHKNTGDWQALLGVNLRCHHLSWYTMEGVAKRDYPASIFYQSAWYDAYTYVEDYFARLGMALSAGRPVCDVLAINPIESVWGYVRQGCFEGLSANSGEIKRLEEAYARQFMCLIDEGVDFDYGDEDILARHARADGGVLSVGAMRYKTVLLSGADHLRATTLALLDKFTAGGGRVVLCGDPPAYVDGKRTSIDCSRFEAARDEAAAARRCALYTAVRLDTGGEKGFLSAVRKTGEGEYLAAVVNLDREGGKEAELTFSVSANVFEYDLRNGREKPCAFVREAACTRVKTSFAKGQERMLIFTQAETPAYTAKPAEVQEIRLEDALPYVLDEPNILVLDTADYYVDGQPRGRAEVLKADRAVRQEFGLPQRGGNAVQPWYRERYGAAEKTKTACRLKLVYRFYAEAFPETLGLVCERPALWDITLNGREIKKKEGGGYFIDNSFKRIPLEATALLPGENTITASCDFSAETDLEAMYLIGGFGVRLDGDGTRRTLTALPDKLSAKKSMSEQGLPFYSGKVTLDTGITEGDVSLSFARMRCAYVSADFGRETETVCFAPYETDVHTVTGRLKLTVCFTRRNTFGPLHVADPKQRAYGPFSFVTEGGEWTDGYTLYDEGLCFPTVRLVRKGG